MSDSTVLLTATDLGELTRVLLKIHDVRERSAILLADEVIVTSKRFEDVDRYGLAGCIEHWRDRRWPLATDGK